MSVEAQVSVNLASFTEREYGWSHQITRQRERDMFFTPDFGKGSDVGRDGTVRTTRSGALDVNLGRLLQSEAVKRDLEMMTHLHESGCFSKPTESK